MPAERDDGVEREPVTCKKCGHFNDPYPKGGQCTECTGMLLGNSFVFKSEDMKDINVRKAQHEKEILNRAKQYIKDAGLVWKETPAIIQDLAIRAATTKNRSDITLLLQQLEMLKPKPKSTEGFIETQFSLELSAKNIEELQNSLEVLDGLL